MEENKKTNSEAIEAKENIAAEDTDKLTDDELEAASGGSGAKIISVRTTVKTKTEKQSGLTPRGN